MVGDGEAQGIIVVGDDFLARVYDRPRVYWPPELNGAGYGGFTNHVTFAVSGYQPANPPPSPTLELVKAMQERQEAYRKYLDTLQGQARQAFKTQHHLQMYRNGDFIKA